MNNQDKERRKASNGRPVFFAPITGVLPALHPEPLPKPKHETKLQKFLPRELVRCPVCGWQHAGNLAEDATGRCPDCSERSTPDASTAG